MKRKLALLAVVGLLAGCGDGADTLSRDYRNLNNEAIDALMVVTSERRAMIANERVLKPFQDRLKAIDTRFDTWVQNKEKVDVAKDTLTSESVAMLFAENKLNQERLAKERARIQNLVKHLKEKNPGADPAKDFPNLNELASGSKTEPVMTHLKSGSKFTQLLTNFPSWKLPAPVLDLNKDLAEKIAKFEKR